MQSHGLRSAIVVSQYFHISRTKLAFRQASVSRRRMRDSSGGGICIPFFARYRVWRVFNPALSVACGEQSSYGHRRFCGEAQRLPAVAPK